MGEIWAPIAATLAAMRSYLEGRGIGFVFADDGEQTKAYGITYAEPEKATAH